MNTRQTRSSSSKSKTSRPQASKPVKEAKVTPPKVKKTPTKKKEEEPVYIVEEILEKKKVKGMVLYKVKWVGFPLDQCTWEPTKNLENVKYMVNDFNKAHKKEEDDEKDNKEKEGEEEEESEEKEDENNEEEDSSKGTPQKKKMGRPAGSGKRRLSAVEKKKESVSRSPEKKIKTEKGVERRGRPPKNANTPQKILHAKQTTNGLIFTIECKQRKDGTVPPLIQMTNYELRKIDKDLLIDYYESKLKFVKPESTVKNNNNKESSEHEEEKAEKRSGSGSMEEEREVDNIINEQKKPENTTLSSENLIQNEGQTVFADLGTNTVQEIRDLTLDPHLRIYDQTHPEGTDYENQGSLIAQDTATGDKEFLIDSPKEVSQTNSI